MLCPAAPLPIVRDSELPSPGVTVSVLRRLWFIKGYLLPQERLSVRSSVAAVNVFSPEAIYTWLPACCLYELHALDEAVTVEYLRGPCAMCVSICRLSILSPLLPPSLSLLLPRCVSHHYHLPVPVMSSLQCSSFFPPACSCVSAALIRP